MYKIRSCCHHISSQVEKVESLICLLVDMAFNHPFRRKICNEECEQYCLHAVCVCIEHMYTYKTVVYQGFYANLVPLKLVYATPLLQDVKLQASECRTNEESEGITIFLRASSDLPCNTSPL